MTQEEKENEKYTIVYDFGAFVRARREELGLSYRELSINLYGNNNQAGWLWRLEHGKLPGSGFNSKRMDEILQLLNGRVEFKKR